MKIVIDIPEENYAIPLTKIMLACRGCKITELPKGHGDLVYRKDVINTIRELAEYHAKYYTGDSITPNRVIANIWQLPTIIESEDNE